MTQSKAVNTPMEAQPDKAITDEQLIDETFYAQATGSSMRLMICTRPDIAFVVGRLSQYNYISRKSLWTFVKPVLRYIRGTASAGSVFSAKTDNSFVPAGYSEKNWAGCQIYRKSPSGYVFCVTGGAIFWKSKKQSIVTTSTAEDEYMAFGIAAQECAWR